MKLHAYSYNLFNNLKRMWKSYVCSLGQNLQEILAREKGGAQIVYTTGSHL